MTISLKACKMDGTVIEDKGSFEYTMGSDTLGPLSRAVDKALSGMKKGEVSKLTCSKDYAYESEAEGVVLELTLEEIFEITDVSPAKDKSLMKKQIKEGEGYERPRDTAQATLRVAAVAEKGTPLQGFEAKVLDFVVGDGTVCDALEFAVAEMKKGERAVLTAPGSLCRDSQLGLAQTQAETLSLTIELCDFEKPKDTWDMSEEEKLDFGAARKEVGGGLFKSGRYHLAMERYKKVADMLSYTDNFKEENKAKALELKKTCTLNKAACQLKLQLFTDAKASCNVVLKDSPGNVKALFRRAQAEFSLKNFLDAIKDAKKVLEIEPKNREARSLVKDAQLAQKEEDQKSKGLFGKMCKALGKGPIPEPYKEKKYDFDEDDVDMEDAEGNQGELKQDEGKDTPAEAAPVAAAGA
ncbi:unnamed protein product [Effrenium voratum]|nr:unnamed protein product [Effrenium voratum]